MNFLKGTITGEKEFTVGSDKIAVPEKFTELLKPYQGKEIVLGIRPEDLRHVAQDSSEQPCIEMDVDVAELLGAETIAHGKYQGQEIVAKVAAREEIHMGSHVKLAMDIDKIHFYDPETTKAID
jgi:multiple sugar transport system ATP-binding protein